MKTILVKVQLQLDQFNDIDSKQYVMETIELINNVLQERFPTESPQIFGNNIDSSDIEISEFNNDK